MRPALTDQEVATFRAEVCRVAGALFARHGVEGVTMRQIAAELDCSATTAYRYFRNKDEILAAVRAAAFNRFSEVIEEASASSPDARKSAHNVGQAYLGFALQNPDAYRMMFDVSPAAVSGSAELTDALARARRSMVRYLAAVGGPGVSKQQTQALGQMLWASTHGLVMLRLSGIVADDAELRQLHRKTMSALVRGAREDKGGRSGSPSAMPIRPVPGRSARKKAP